MDDEGVVEQIVRGNREAFRLLVLRYERPLFRFLGLLGFDGTACQDLAQQTFLSAFRALADFDPARARFSTWLFTIAKHQAAHERERAHRRYERPMAEAPEVFARSTALDPAQTASVSQQMRRLNEGLQSLAPELRSTFLLAQLEELSLEEVAAVEKCAVGTVKSRIHRARERLRLALAVKESS
jgi:RNA polymerase sigma-70 factor (ECF subfamily)